MGQCKTANEKPETDNRQPVNWGVSFLARLSLWMVCSARMRKSHNPRTDKQNMKLRIVGIIPARYDSSRFPGKALADLAGKPMVRHVVERAARRPTSPPSHARSTT